MGSFVSDRVQMRCAVIVGDMQSGFPALKLASHAIEKKAEKRPGSSRMKPLLSQECGDGDTTQRIRMRITRSGGAQMQRRSESVSREISMKSMASKRRLTPHRA